MRDTGLFERALRETIVDRLFSLESRPTYRSAGRASETCHCSRSDGDRFAGVNRSADTPRLQMPILSGSILASISMRRVDSEGTRMRRHFAYCRRMYSCMTSPSAAQPLRTRVYSARSV